jgi:UDP-N-acetylmuramoylalanine--D-glutamate ligase
MINPGDEVAILGLGVSGRAAARYALWRGAKVRISDSRPKERFLVEEKELLELPGVTWEAGGHSFEFLNWAKRILISPGVDLSQPLLHRLAKAGVALSGELAVAARELHVPTVAITGTNGKTTTTTLVGELLEAGGIKAFVGGNIGTPIYDFLREPQGRRMVVAEVSSFQLESAGDFAPQIGILLNITPDHLDRHGSIEVYGQVKMRLFAHQRAGDLAIVNGDDPLCRRLASEVPGELQTFGSGPDNTAQIIGKTIRVSLGEEVEEYPLEATALGNSVGLQNGAAAILAARRLGVAHGTILTALRAFRLLPHRIELVAEVGGVRYYNDSKATNTGAVLGALEEFSGNVLLIAGGRDKGDDYRLLRPAAAASVRLLITIGEAAELLEAALADVVKTHRAASMAEAVRLAAARARRGDVVLLSPACASFDMFKNYGHRGDEFRKEVEALAAAPVQQSEEKRP